MSPERIHEALNLLDEDMIQAVEQLRGRKPALRWPRWVALAACLAVVCALGLYQSGLLDRAESGDTDAQREQMAELATPPRLEQENAGVLDEGDEHVQIQSGTAAEAPSVLVRIDSWRENGFAGTVWGTVDTDVYCVGEQVNVVFQADIRLAVEENGTVSYRKLAYGDRPFSEGSVVRVMVALTPDDASVGSENAQTVLYVQQISPGE